MNAPPVNTAEFRATAGLSSSRGTRSGMMACRVGWSNASTIADVKLMAMTCQTSINPVATRTAITRDSSAATLCIIQITLRLSIRSAKTPPKERQDDHRYGKRAEDGAERERGTGELVYKPALDRLGHPRARVGKQQAEEEQRKTAVAQHRRREAAPAAYGVRFRDSVGVSDRGPGSVCQCDETTAAARRRVQYAHTRFRRRSLRNIAPPLPLRPDPHLIAHPKEPVAIAHFVEEIANQRQCHQAVFEPYPLNRA